MLRSAAFLLFLAASTIADCPPGTTYESLFDKCYKFVNTSKSFFDAEQYCNSMGGHLVDIESAIENSYLVMLASNGNSIPPNFWIGAILLGSWEWTSKAPMYNVFWAPGQPNDANPCAYVNGSATSGKNWATLPCNNPLPFMCKFNTTAEQPVQPSTTPSPDDTFPCFSHCTDGYTQYSGNCLCYKYFNSTYLSFSEAEDTCVQKGGKGGMLAKIPSEDVNDFLTKLPGFNTAGYDCPWIGLTCTSNALNSCYWADGTPLGSYSNFYSFGWGYYVIVSVVTPRSPAVDGKWEADSMKSAYICQKASTRAVNTDFKGEHDIFGLVAKKIK